MIFDFFQDAVIIFFEVICCKIFFQTFAVPKDNRRFISYIIIVGLAGIICFWAYLFENYFILKEIVIVISTTVFMNLYFDLRVLSLFLLSVLYQNIVLLIDYCGFSFISFYFYSYEDISEQYIIEGKLIIAFCKICLFFVILVINRKMKYRAVELLNNNEWLRFISFPVFTMGIIAAIISVFHHIDKPQQANVLFVMAFGLIGMNIFIFFLLNDILQREREIRNEKVFFLEARNQTDIYQSISENFDKQRKKTHEFKNQIMCIEGLLKQKRYEKAEEYVNRISGDLNIEIDIINTNNMIVNAILNVKYQEIIEKNIVFVIKINDLSLLPLEDMDIVVILSNLLNNAIEAAEKCSENKIIRLKFEIESDVTLSVENTYVEKPKIKNGKIVTNKEDEWEHGIGIKNVIEIVQKYHGTYVMKDEGNAFLFSISIPRAY